MRKGYLMPKKWFLKGTKRGLRRVSYFNIFLKYCNFKNDLDLNYVGWRQFANATNERKKRKIRCLDYILYSNTNSGSELILINQKSFDKEWSISFLWINTQRPTFNIFLLKIDKPSVWGIRKNVCFFPNSSSSMNQKLFLVWRK